LFRIKGLLRLGQQARPFWLQQVARRSELHPARAGSAQDMYLVFIAQSTFDGRASLMQGLQDCLLRESQAA